MALYFRVLDQKFVNRQNNGIFSPINEFCTRYQSNNNEFA